MKRRQFIKRGSLLLPTIFIPRLIRAQTALTAEGLASFGTNAPAGGGGGGGTDFLTGIALQYIADNVSGSDGTAITAWPDSSGNSRNLAHTATGQDPVIKVGNVNGHRAVLFDGSNDCLSVSIAPSVLGSSNQSTLFAVIKQTGTQAQNCLCNLENIAYSCYATYNDAILFDMPYNSGSGRLSKSQPAGWDDAWHVLECYRNGATSEILVDGSSLGTGSVSGSLSGSANNFVLGAFNIGAGTPFKGYIAEFRIYPTAVGSTDRATVRTYLKGQYGTP